MKALTVIERLDVIKDGDVSLVASFEDATENQLQFERAPEGLHLSVIVAIAFAAHGGFGLGTTQSTAEGGASVLGAAV